MHKNKTKEPLFHIAKRAALPWYLSWACLLYTSDAADEL